MFLVLVFKLNLLERNVDNMINWNVGNERNCVFYGCKIYEW